MRWKLAGRPAAALVCALIVPPARGDDPPGREAASKPATSSADTSREAVVERASPADVAAARAETKERLQSLAKPDDKTDSAPAKGLKELLDQRLHWLDELDNAVEARKRAEHPQDDPEAQAGQLKADLERTRGLLKRSEKDPASLLPEAVRDASGRASPEALKELKEAIDAAQAELERMGSAEVSQKASSPLAACRAERDKTRERCAALAARRAECEAALKAAEKPATRDLAREKLINLEWEARVEAERLGAREAELALETKRAVAAELKFQVTDLGRQRTRRALDAMQARYRSLAERQQAELQKAARNEENRAAHTDDPLEKYRARRAKEILDLEGQALKDEKDLASPPAVSLDDQTKRADRALEEFEELQRLVKEDRSSALVALRLKNDFRRLSYERSTIVRNDLARATAWMTYYENLLTSVELDLFNDERGDRFLRDGLLELLPPARHGEALAIFNRQEVEHKNLLERRKTALDKLARQAAKTHDQVLRRLRALDAQYDFARTHIFWVRDADPFGLGALVHGQLEFRHLVRSVLRIVAECGERSSWGRISAEFLLLATAALVLPWPLLQLRKALRNATWAAPDAPPEPAA